MARRNREVRGAKRTLPGAHRRWRSRVRASHELGGVRQAWLWSREVRGYAIRHRRGLWRRLYGQAWHGSSFTIREPHLTRSYPFSDTLLDLDSPGGAEDPAGTVSGLDADVRLGGPHRDGCLEALAVH